MQVSQHILHPTMQSSFSAAKVHKGISSLGWKNEDIST